MVHFSNVLTLFGLIAATTTSANVSLSPPNLRSRQSRNDNSTVAPQPSSHHRIQDGPILLVADDNLNATQDHRQMQQAAARTVLIIRVINANTAPVTDASTLRQYIFTHTNSLKAQMMRCSANQVVFTESPYGIVDVRVNTNMKNVDLAREAINAAPAVLGIRDLRTAADHVMFIFPKISDFFAEAEVNNRFSYYNDEYGASLSVLMHELGHNLGLYHGGVAGDEYGDYSGQMGRSLVRRGGPLFCFNAANHWDLGFYGSGRLDLGTTGPATPASYALAAYSNFPAGGPVLIKIAGNIFMQYSHASAHNADTEFPNKVVIIEKTSALHTIRLASLGPNEEYYSANFAIKACRNRMAGVIPVMDISIGRSTTNCNTSVTGPVSAPVPVPAPRPVPVPVPVPRPVPVPVPVPVPTRPVPVPVRPVPVPVPVPRPVPVPVPRPVPVPVRPTTTWTVVPPPAPIVRPTTTWTVVPPPAPRT